MFFKHPPLVLARDKENSSETQVFDALLSKCEALQVGSRANDYHGAIPMMPCIIEHPGNVYPLLQERCQNSVARCTLFKQEAEQSQEQVQQFVKTQADRKEQMYIKVSITEYSGHL